MSTGKVVETSRVIMFIPKWVIIDRFGVSILTSGNWVSYGRI